MHNGVLTQLNQNGNREDKTADVVHSANDIMFERILKSTDFKHPAS